MIDFSEKDPFLSLFTLREFLSFAQASGIPECQTWGFWNVYCLAVKKSAVFHSR